jgi:hypothetical protein
MDLLTRKMRVEPISPAAAPCCNWHHWGELRPRFQALSIKWI